MKTVKPPRPSEGAIVDMQRHLLSFGWKVSQEPAPADVVCYVVRGTERAALVHDGAGTFSIKPLTQEQRR
jgi:hypothetical protein